MGKTVNRREYARRVIAASPAYPSNPLRPWQLITAPLLGLLVWLAVTAPGAMSDLASLPLGDWRWFVGVRVTVILMCGMALFVVRGHPPLLTAAMLLTAVGLTFRIGVGQTLEEPLTLGFALLMLALITLPIGVIVRPNAADRLRAAAARVALLERENAELRQRAQVAEAKARLRQERL